MDIFHRMVSTQALLFLFIALGFVVRKTGIITRESRGSYNLFLINVTLPAMILSAFLQQGSADELKNAWLILFVSASVSLLAYPLGKWLWRRYPQAEQSVLTFGGMFSNAGNAGMPVVQLVYGEAGLLFASIFLIPARILMWTLGVWLFLPEKGKGGLRQLLLNPSVLVVFLGLFMMFTGLEFPSVINQAVKKVGDITGPLAMILIGTTLAEMDFKEAFCKEAWLLSGLRLIILPLMTLLLLRLIGLDWFLISVAVTLVAMPVATNTAVLSERYGADYRLASKCVFLSTVLSLFTVPAITLL